jgi:hypothetical protein
MQGSPLALDESRGALDPVGFLCARQRDYRKVFGLSDKEKARSFYSAAAFTMAGIRGRFWLLGYLFSCTSPPHRCLHVLPSAPSRAWLKAESER